MSETFGAIVSRAGHDATTAAVENKIFSSEYPFFKIHSDTTASLTIPTPNTTGRVNVSHNLGYVPSFISYVSFWADDYQRLVPLGVAPQPMIITAFATSAAISCKINFIGSDQNRTAYFRVIIFKDKIA